MTDKQPKVIVIGLDGATFDLIEPWIKEGHLPTIKRLMERGVKARCISVIPPVSSAAWASIVTGKNPGKHGIFDFSRRRKGDYSYEPVSSRDLKSKTVWEILNSRGYKTICVKVPGTYPPKQINGALITGFPTIEENEDFVYPPKLLNELREKFGDFRLQPKNPIGDAHEDSFLAEMLEITEIQTEIVIYLMKKFDWSFLMNVFMATDAVAHHFFKYLDEEHPSFNKEKSKKYSDSILKSYKKVDTSIEKILKEAGEEATVFLISDHGFSSCYYAFYSNTWLLKEGYLKIRQHPVSLFKYLLFKSGFTINHVYKALKKLGFGRKAHQSVYKKGSIYQRLKDILFISSSDFDWEKSRAYSMGNFGQIYINLKGREPMGCVKPEEYPVLVEEIIGKLKQLRDPWGDYFFDIIKKGNEIYSGPYAQKGADILFLNSKSRYCAVRTMELGHNKLISSHPLWSGAHALDGIFVAYGPEIKSGLQLDNVNLFDLVPTILHIFGLQPEDDMDGRVLDIFNEHSVDLSKSKIKARTGEDVKIKSKVRKLKDLGKI